MKKCKVYINGFSILNSLGGENKTISEKMGSAGNAHKSSKYKTVNGNEYPCFYYGGELPELAKDLVAYNSRNNRMICKILGQLDQELDYIFSKYDKKNIGVVFGTSTSGIDEGITALKNMKNFKLPKEYNYSIQEISSPSSFIADLFGIKGPSYTVSTACSSGAKTFIEGVSLIQNGVCDVVLVGACDTLNDLTLNGFESLGALSSENCIPFSRNRSGINIGEGGGLFILSKEESEIEILGVGQSSDGYHTSSPDPSGSGAMICMREALSNSSLKPDDIDYINLHGTGTLKNDSMESVAVNHIFGDKKLVSSTKPFFGHCLGAAGAMEIGVCALLLSTKNKLRKLPPHVWDNCVDENLARLNYVNELQINNVKYCMSNSYAFGGNNVSIVLGGHDE